MDATEIDKRVVPGIVVFRQCSKISVVDERQPEGNLGVSESVNQ